MTRRGFTLIEMMVAMTVMMILYMSVPDIVSQLQPPRLQRAVSDTGMLAAGLWGPNPDHAGYMGDIGLPSNVVGVSFNGTTNNPSYIAYLASNNPPFAPLGDGIVNDLVFPTATAFSYPANSTVLNNALGVPIGWNGPYAGFDVAGLAVDPWSNPWQVNGSGQVVSAGPDGVFGTADDVVSPNGGAMITGATTPTPLAGTGGPMMRSFTGQVALTVRDVDGSYITNNAALEFVIWGPAITQNPRGQLSRTVILPGAATVDSTSSAFILSGGVGSITPGRHAIEIYGSGTATVCGEGLGSATGAMNNCAGLYGHTVVNVMPGAVAVAEVRLRESSDYPGIP